MPISSSTVKVTSKVGLVLCVTFGVIISLAVAGTLLYLWLTWKRGNSGINGTTEQTQVSSTVKLKGDARRSGSSNKRSVNVSPAVGGTSQPSMFDDRFGKLDSQMFLTEDLAAPSKSDLNLDEFVMLKRARPPGPTSPKCSLRVTFPKPQKKSVKSPTPSVKSIFKTAVTTVPLTVSKNPVSLPLPGGKKHSLMTKRYLAPISPATGSRRPCSSLRRGHLPSGGKNAPEKSHPNVKGTCPKKKTKSVAPIRTSH